MRGLEPCLLLDFGEMFFSCCEKKKNKNKIKMEGCSRSARFITEILGATIPRTANTSISRLWVWSYARNAPMQPLISCAGDLREPLNYSFAGPSGNEKRVVVGVGARGKKKEKKKDL